MRAQPAHAWPYSTMTDASLSKRNAIIGHRRSLNPSDLRPRARVALHVATLAARTFCVKSSRERGFRKLASASVAQSPEIYLRAGPIARGALVAKLPHEPMLAW